MKIQDLIENFEKECLSGENRFRNILFYDSLLDKIRREARMQWNLENIRSYLSIIWHRLKKECPNTYKRYFNKDEEFPSVNKGEQIVVEPYGDGFIAIFNTNLKDWHSDDIYCLFVKDDNSKFVELDSSTARLYPFCSREELSYLRANETIGNDLKDKILVLISRIKQDFSNSLPGIGLKPKSFNCENLTIKINEPKMSIYKSKDGYQIDPLRETRKCRIKKAQKEGRNVEDVLGRRKNVPESLLSGWDHIIIDGSDNLPLSLLNMIFNRKYYYIDKYMTQVDIIENIAVYGLLKDIIQRAINRSIKESSEKNYIASIYYIALDKISYLLPLYIMQREKPDCALVFNKINDEYVGVTLMSINEARTDARVLSKIDDYEWMF